MRFSQRIYMVQNMQGRNRLERLRQAAGLTQRQIGDLLGKDPSTISRYETGEVAIPDAHKIKLAAHFGVSVSHLMSWDNGEDGNGGRGTREIAAA